MHTANIPRSALNEVAVSLGRIGELAVMQLQEGGQDQGIEQRCQTLLATPSRPAKTGEVAADPASAVNTSSCMPASIANPGATPRWSRRMSAGVRTCVLGTPPYITYRESWWRPRAGRETATPAPRPGERNQQGGD
jgi:hypothetical protein